MNLPVDNLIRARSDVGAVEIRADAEGEGRTLFGHFAVFNRWTEIDSMWEGRFLERIAPGAFARTMGERRDQIKVLYDHGKDPQLGNKPLGTITDLREDKTGAYYEVELLRTSYNDDFVIPASSAGVLGASFRFHVAGEEINEPRASTKHNPEKLPERTVTDIDLYEFGPVTFPAYAEASVGVRSGTDEFFDRLKNDPLFLARMIERVGITTVEHLLTEGPPPTARTEATPVEPAVTPVDPVAPVAPVASADGQTTSSKSTQDVRRHRARQIVASRKGAGKR